MNPDSSPKRVKLSSVPKCVGYHVFGRSLVNKGEYAVFFENEGVALEVPTLAARSFDLLRDAMENVEDEEDEPIISLIPSTFSIHVVMAAMCLILPNGKPGFAEMESFIKENRSHCRCGDKEKFDAATTRFSEVHKFLHFMGYDKRHTPTLMYMMYKIGNKACRDDFIQIKTGIHMSTMEMYSARHFDAWRVSTHLERQFELGDETSNLALLILADRVKPRTTVDEMAVFYPVDTEKGDNGLPMYSVLNMRTMRQNIMNGYNRVIQEYVNRWYKPDGVRYFQSTQVARIYAPEFSVSEPAHRVVACTAMLRTQPSLYDYPDIDFMELYSNMRQCTDYPANNNHYFGCLDRIESGSVFRTIHSPTPTSAPHAAAYFKYALPIQVVSLMYAFSRKLRMMYDQPIMSYHDAFESLYISKMKDLEPYKRIGSGKWRMLQHTHRGYIMFTLNPTVEEDGMVAVRDLVVEAYMPTRAEFEAGNLSPLTERHMRTFEWMMAVNAETFNEWKMSDDFPRLNKMDRMFFTPWDGVYFSRIGGSTGTFMEDPRTSPDEEWV